MQPNTCFLEVLKGGGDEGHPKQSCCDNMAVDA